MGISLWSVILNLRARFTLINHFLFIINYDKHKLMNKIINFTPTGTQTNKENSFAPLTPNEIIEEVHEAYELGITLTHIHARDPITFENTYKKMFIEKLLMELENIVLTYQYVYH